MCRIQLLRPAFGSGLRVLQLAAANMTNMFDAWLIAAVMHSFMAVNSSLPFIVSHHRKRHNTIKLTKIYVIMFYTYNSIVLLLL